MEIDIIFWRHHAPQSVEFPQRDPHGLFCNHDIAHRGCELMLEFPSTRSDISQGTTDVSI